MAIALFPGTFDPVTLGHLDLIRRASQHFDQLIVAVGANIAKTPWLSAEQRAQIIRDSLPAGNDRIRVATFDGLLIDFAAQVGATAVVKGIRSGSDFDFEATQAATNRELGGLETFLLPASARWAHVSSSLVRELATWGGDFARYVPPAAERALAATRVPTQKGGNHA